MNKTTSWGQVADWYDSYLADTDTYQEQVIKPNLLRLLKIKKGEKILDLACGSGFFARALASEGAGVVGVDVSKELIAVARRHTKSEANITYFSSPSHKLEKIADHSMDKAIVVLALQNIAEVKGTLVEVKRVLKPGGSFHIVLNHPAFRIPKGSSWGWSEEKKMQYRRVDQYLTESKVAIEMHPGLSSETTISFHRPLQYYFKLLGAAGFAVTRLEEWISHRESEPGKRSEAENKARHEFPLFLFLEAVAII